MLGAYSICIILKSLLCAGGGGEGGGRMGRGAPFTANLAFYFLADWAPGGQDNIGIFFSTHTHSFLPFRR